MCGRYSLSKGEKIIEIVPNITMKADLREVGRWNIAPTQDVLVVANRPGRAGEFQAQTMRWGLIPSWAKDPSIGNKMINARAEPLAQKPAFRHSLERRRCIIPADGFYEWRKNPGGAKTPMYLRLKNGQAFGFAGLWDIWRDDQGKPLETCTIAQNTPEAREAKG